MNEPLKDKIRRCECEHPVDIMIKNVFDKTDISSAVEWLRSKGKCFDKMSKEKLPWKVVKERLKVGLKNTMFFVVDYNDFNKAFEDVTKEAKE